jgi:Lipocalin-like domain
VSRVSLAIGCVFLLWSIGAVAQKHDRCDGPQVGTWKLVSYTTEDLVTGQKTDLLGPHPSGFLSYTSDCRMSAILVKDSRAAPAASVATDAESIELYRGLIAYAGHYEIDGDKVHHHVEVSWNQAWTGTTQSRAFIIQGTSLYIRTMPAKSALSGKQSSSVLVWTRVP